MKFHNLEHLLYNSSTPSHLSEEENRPKIAAKIARVNGPLERE